MVAKKFEKHFVLYEVSAEAEETVEHWACNLTYHNKMEDSSRWNYCLVFCKNKEITDGKSSGVLCEIVATHHVMGMALVKQLSACGSEWVKLLVEDEF
jgi:hypothetical protein